MSRFDGRRAPGSDPRQPTWRKSRNQRTAPLHKGIPFRAHAPVHSYVPIPVGANSHVPVFRRTVMSDTFKCKTDKNGEFEVKKDKPVPKNPLTGNLLFDEVSIKGKLTKPPKLVVEGTLSFNGAKKTFKKKTGEEQDF